MVTSALEHTISLLLRSLTSIGAVIVVACADGSRPETRTLGGNRVAGILFDPTAVVAGDRIGVLTLGSIEVRAAHDSTRVGTARFSGPLGLTGNAIRHFDSDVTDLCFEADSASAATIPRWRGDERRAWFCFENQGDAKRQLGAAGDSSRKSILVDRFTIHRGLSDGVNSARLVRVIGF